MARSIALGDYISLVEFIRYFFLLGNYYSFYISEFIELQP